MSLRRVAITGLGVVSPYGGTVDAFFGHMLAGRSAVQLLQTEDKPRPLRMPFVTCHAFDPAESVATLDSEHELALHEMPGQHAIVHAWESRPGSGSRVSRTSG